MLSLSPLRASASGASNYYLEEEKQFHINQLEFTITPDNLERSDKESSLQPTENPTANYYLAEKSGEQTTQWYGKIAEKEGILGQAITHEKLETVLNGTLDNSAVKGAGSDNRRTGYDLVFSAPKGASLLALVYGDNRIIDAHENATKKAISMIEKDTAQYRQVDPNTREASYTNSQNLLFGLVQHKTSRENDPQLHTHALLANMTHDKDGSLKNLASSAIQNGFETQGTYERILENQKYYTRIYHSELGRSLEQMGYNIQSLGKGQIDIAGIPEDVLESNSTRRQQILEQAEGLGINTGKSRDHIAHQTRKAKTYTPEHSLQKEWLEKNEKLGFDGLTFVAQSHTKTHHPEHSPKAPILPAITQAIENSVNYLSDRNTAISYEKIITTALDKFAPEHIVQFSQFKQALDNTIKEDKLIALDKNKTLFTTPTLLDAEKKLIETTNKRSHGLVVHADEKSLEQTRLKSESQQLIRDVLSSKKQVNVINLIGSSQQISEALLHVTENSGKAIHFITPNKLVQQQTEQQVKRQAFSVTQWVKNAFRSDVVYTTHQYNNKPALRQQTKDSILVIEHAHKLGIKDTQALIEQAQSQGNKIVFLNHTQRSQGLRAGNAMDILQKGNTQVSRWQGTHQSQTALHTTEVDKQDRHQVIAEHYQQLSPQERANTQVLATNKADNDKLNAALRHQLDKTGQLSEKRVEIPVLNPVYLSPEQQASIKNYQKGMIFNEINDGKMTRYKVEKVNTKAKTLQLIDADKNRRYFNVADAKNTTFFVSQPSTLEVAAGDRLRINSDIYQTNLKQHDNVTIEKIGWLGLSLKDDNGKGHIVSLSQFKDTALSYGYATPLNQAASGKETTLVDMQSYTASKEVLYDLMQQESKTLHIFTNDQQKLEAQMGKSSIQPSTMARVLASTGDISKFINSQTQQSLYHDVGVAVQSLLHQQADKPLIEQAVMFALNHVSEQKAGFKHEDLVMEAIRFAMDEKGTTVLEPEIKAHLHQLKAQDSVLSADYQDGTRWTTREALETEQRILNHLEAGKDAVNAFATPQQADTYLAQQAWMTDGQKDGVRLIATTNDQYTIVQGFAGVGKSTMLEQGTLLIEQAQAIQKNTPITVLGLAPTHAAVNELKEKGIPAQTTQSLLKDVMTGDTLPEKYANTLFLLDESSMASNAQFDAFTTLVNNSGARATFLGDIYQLQSKEAGKPFELAYRTKNIETVVMKDIKRQQTPELLSAVKQVINRHPESTLAAVKAQSPLDNQHYHQPSMHTDTVISTYINTGQPSEDHQQAKDKLYDLAAKEYLSRTPESRDNTLMIAYSNRERDLLAKLIRRGLKAMGDLPSGSDTSVTRLRGVGATKEELKTMMPYQKGLIINTGRETYLQIDKVDRQHALLNVTDLGSGKVTTFIPAKHDHKMTTLWSSSQQPLTEGDKITWRKTDRELALQGNTELTVSKVNTQTMTVTGKDGQAVMLPLSDMKSSHWDYRYTKTADMAQGATVNNVISVISANAKLTNIRRAYIDISRASQHAMIFTDNEKSLMNSWLNHHDNNTSAIETINKTHNPNERHFNTTDLPNENPKYQQDGHFKLSLYAKDLGNQLTPYTESLAISLLGQPNNSKSDKDYLAFGRGKSQTKISLTGECRGYFRDWTTGDKGNMINLIMASKSISFREAITLAETMLTHPEQHDLIKNEKHATLLTTLPVQVSELKERAINYFEQGVDIKDTPASTYINNQTYHDVESHTALRYHDNVYSSETKSTHPALLTSLTNNKGDIEAVEITYLTPQGDIANLNTQKRLMGNKSGHAMVLNEGTLPNISVIAIGIENGIALMGANQHDVDIIAVNNPHDLRTVNTQTLREHIIIMASNSQLSNQALIHDITHKLTEQGHSISLVTEALNGLLPQDIGIIISDKVNDDITQLKGEHHTQTNAIDQLAKDIIASSLPDNKDIELSHSDTDKKDITYGEILTNKEVDHAIDDYEQSNHQTEKDHGRIIEKELDDFSI
ncbi:conjugative transfer relaxase/helicase TraI [Photobacterium carnosum]|uniref:Conjugative transfer relaxase/helicase TraI n=2 Tax=Photobacterium carnosum TaxID=2023717 RepID=A0A2N4UNJ4_9GAMM|nr:conjugative transfer relaxase/helicase TraI [Photobacterium carnosum]MCD9554507.1 conjugative transfer relaxase/helicase TraI [Photobacterium carnosum]PLC56585.1 conjugative transfer relaxase/helicase TraI [Photobacterium carnosum]